MIKKLYFRLLTSSIYIQLLFIFLLGVAVSYLCVYLTLARGIPLEAWGEPGKYTMPAKDWMLQGSYVVFDEGTGAYKAFFARLPGFPLFLRIIYSLFGVDNYFAVASVQCLCIGMIACLTALSARAIKPSWTLLAGLLSCCWPNLVYRAATIMPEVFFTLEISIIVCALLWLFPSQNTNPLSSHYVVALRVRRCARRFTTLTPSSPCAPSIALIMNWYKKLLPQYILLVTIGLGMGAALMTRPSFLIFPFFLLPLVFFIFLNSLHYSFLRSVSYIMVMIGAMLCVTLPYFLRGYNALGGFVYTTQSGDHLARWVYPCLRAEWGCGKRNMEAFQQANDLINKELAKLNASDLQNDRIVNAITKKVGADLIRELPTITVLKAFIGGQIKLWFHNAFYEIKERYLLPGKSIMLSEVNKEKGNFILNYMKGISANPWMFMWILFETGLLVTRMLQLIGCISGIISKEYRYATLIITMACLALTLTTIGVGNPRYRVPVEPLLILLTLLGIEKIKTAFFVKT